MGGLVLGAVALALRYLRRPSPTTLEPLPMVESNVAMAATTGEPRRRVVVTGLGIASVFGNDVDEYYDALLEGKSGIKMIDKFDTVRYLALPPQSKTADDDQANGGPCHLKQSAHTEHMLATSALDFFSRLLHNPLSSAQAPKAQKP